MILPHESFQIHNVYTSYSLFHVVGHSNVFSNYDNVAVLECSLECTLLYQSYLMNVVLLVTRALHCTRTHLLLPSEKGGHLVGIRSRCVLVHKFVLPE